MLAGVSTRNYATAALEALAAQLERRWPDAAASLREGLAETVTITKLGITGTLARTLATTNPISVNWLWSLG